MGLSLWQWSQHFVCSTRTATGGTGFAPMPMLTLR